MLDPDPDPDEMNADPQPCFIGHCFICRPSDSTVSEDTEIESSARIYRTSFRPKRSFSMTKNERFGLVFAETSINLGPGLLRLWHWQSDALSTRLDLIHARLYLAHLSFTHLGETAMFYLKLALKYMCTV